MLNEDPGRIYHSDFSGGGEISQCSIKCGTSLEMSDKVDLEFHDFWFG